MDGTKMPEAEKGLRCLEAYKQLPVLKTALETYRDNSERDSVIDLQTRAAKWSVRNAESAHFNICWNISRSSN